MGRSQRTVSLSSSARLGGVKVSAVSSEAGGMDIFIPGRVGLVLGLGRRSSSTLGADLTGRFGEAFLGSFSAGIAPLLLGDDLNRAGTGALAQLSGVTLRSVVNVLEVGVLLLL